MTFGKRNHGVRVWVGHGNDVTIKIPTRAGGELAQAYREGRVTIRGKAPAVRVNSKPKGDRASTQLRISTRLVRALRRHHPYSSGHVVRVSVYAREIAEAMGLRPWKVRQVVLAARLHDTGKLALPRWLLNWTNPRLSRRQLAMIQAHPEKGARLLEPIAELRPLLPGVRYHHEHFDGSGYPGKRKGKRIPLNARIIAVADAFDAMTTSRTYQRAMPVEQAISTLQRLAGTKFDPKVVSHFVQLLPKSRRAQNALRLASRGL